MSSLLYSLSHSQCSGLLLGPQAKEQSQLFRPFWKAMTSLLTGEYSRGQGLQQNKDLLLDPASWYSLADLGIQTRFLPLE